MSSSFTSAPTPSPDTAPFDCDVLVVGGGINGCGIARDLAGRGWRVLLAEKDDLASHTSSASTKLIHGGLRYLEHREFRLVRKALQEREVLLASAPHIMRPLRFVMPHDAAMRPAWLIRLGLFLYDHLARRRMLAGSRGIDLRSHPAGAPLQARFTRGFVYSDGWVDDARLVVLNALDARARGAQVLTRTRVVAAQRDAQGWQVTLQSTDAVGAAPRTVRARALVNAAGPWAEAFLRGVARPARGESLATRQLRLVKGSHIVVPRLFTHDHAYIFQGADQRIIFAIPYEQDFTLIGTTDVEMASAPEGGPARAQIDEAEIAYLCAQASHYFARAVVPADVVWTYSGVRPLLDDAEGDPSAVTRDYLLERHSDGAPLLTVWGGKITTFRKLAEDAADAIGQMLGDTRAPWTHGATLAGGDLAAWLGGRAPADELPQQLFARFAAGVAARWPWLPASVAQRLAHAYGARIDELLGDASALADLGEEVAPGLYARELDFLRRTEWACKGDDVLWRRSKLGLHCTPAQREAVQDWMQARAAADGA